MLKYYLESFQNIDSQPGSSSQYIARVKGEDTLQGKALHQRLAMRSGLREHEVAAVLAALGDEVCDSLREGRRVNLQGLAQFIPSVQGTFDDINELRDAKRHQVKVGVRVPPKLKRDINCQLSWERVHAPDTRLRPNVTAIFNARHEHVTTLKPGMPLKVYGARLKFNEAAPDEGVFLVPLDKFPHEGIPLQDLVMNTPQWLIAQAPYDLPPGDYQLEVRSRMRDCTTLVVGVGQQVLSVETQSSTAPNQAVA
ncbi:DUF4469 domain-containing protein [Cerasicoccus maritimus]|uniref:HU family DNA-binding protein n=1 Tax=Cerasicoccus maritimus TaxID=490089 RepID=UPI002852BD55|nr:DUF4469 domain-containing protein [Cerasicoccus maritimus]